METGFRYIIKSKVHSRYWFGIRSTFRVSFRCRRHLNYHILFLFSIRDQKFCKYGTIPNSGPDKLRFEVNYRLDLLRDNLKQCWHQFWIYFFSVGRPRSKFQRERGRQGEDYTTTHPQEGERKQAAHKTTHERFYGLGQRRKTKDPESVSGHAQFEYFQNFRSPMEGDVQFRKTTLLRGTIQVV